MSMPLQQQKKCFEYTVVLSRKSTSLNSHAHVFPRESALGRRYPQNATTYTIKESHELRERNRKYRINLIQNFIITLYII